MNQNKLRWLEQPGASDLLIRLSEKDEFITMLIRTVTNPDGVATQSGLSSLRVGLGVEKGIGLINEEERKAKGPRPRLYLFLTPLGRRVAEHLKAIERILSES